MIHIYFDLGSFKGGLSIESVTNITVNTPGGKLRYNYSVGITEQPLPASWRNEMYTALFGLIIGGILYALSQTTEKVLAIRQHL